MVSFTEAVGNAVRSLRCQVLGANAFVNGAIGLVAPGLVATYDDQIARSRRLLGCDPENDPSPPPPPFEGGQCSFSYSVGTRGTATCPTSSTDVISRATGMGPISSITSATVPRQAFPANRLTTWTVQFADGQDTFQAAHPESVTPCANVFPLDDGPDTCGDPPPTYPPPTTINFNTDVTYNIDDGTEVTVNIPFTFSPIQIDFDGSLRVPFTFDFGGFTFDGSFSLNPSIGITINPPRLNPGDGQGTETLPPGEPEDEVDPRPPSEKIIGVVVSSSIQNTSNLTTISTQNMPNIVAPRLGSIKFAYSLGLTTFWSNDIDIKGDRVFIPCPFSQGADAAVASPVPGVSLSFVEIKGFPLATTGDLGQPS